MAGPSNSYSANGVGALPEVLTIFQSLDTTLIWVVGGLRVVLMIVSVAWFFFATLNLYTVSTNGEKRFFASQNRPTSWGCFLQMYISALLFLVSYNFTPAIILGTMVSPTNTNITMLTIQAYSSNASDPYSDLTLIVRRVVQSVFFLIGFIAVSRGFSAWYQKNQGTSNESASRITGWIFMGSLCFFPEFLNALLASAIGFDFFGWFINLTVK